MIINVHTVEYDGGTVAVAIGTDEDGNEIRFGGDWRPMSQIAQIIEDTDENVDVEIEDWQILRTNA